MKFILNFCIILILCSKAFSVGLELVIPDYIIADLRHEIQESDFLSISKEQKQKLLNQLQNEKFSYARLLELLSKNLGQEFSKLNQLAKISFTNLDVTLRPEIKTIKFNSESKHSIENLSTYAQNRIGVGTYDFASEQHLSVYVVGGSVDQITEYSRKISGLGTYQITPIPTLYSHWGIYKFEIASISNPTQKNLVWIVPPSLQYVQHYAELFSFATKTESYYWIDENSKISYQKKMQKNANSVFRKLQKPDYLIFGYNYLWKEQIQKSNAWEIVQETSFQNLLLGQSYVELTLKSKDKLNTELIRLGLVSSNQTVWGELASLNLSSYFHQNLKAVFFLGSAGSIDAGINPYSISAPKKFQTSQEKLLVNNLIGQDSGLTANSDMHFHAQHGNTFSPIEQNKNYLLGLKKHNIGTIDVEQSLLAMAVAGFNIQYNTKIQFGAVNVITDKPIAAFTKQGGLNNLDQTNQEMKAAARAKAVHLAFDTLIRHQITNSCKKLFL